MEGWEEDGKLSGLLAWFMASNNRKPVSNKVKDRTATSKVVPQPYTLTSTHTHEHTPPHPHPTHILYSAVLGLSEYVCMRIK